MERPDIVMIVLDTHRADAISFYREQLGLSNIGEITPNLDALCNDCLVFTHALSPAQWTVPAHNSFWTGLYPSEHGVKDFY
ncbi:MAG: sulfatase-like hydrolase/transferase [Nanoarchaeota archaeon]|nr:sulfatase-like hydrolase/transferase [Nanoarchaeota archaeon]